MHTYYYAYLLLCIPTTMHTYYYAMLMLPCLVWAGIVAQACLLLWPYGNGYRRRVGRPLPEVSLPDVTLTLALTLTLTLTPALTSRRRGAGCRCP